MWTKTEYEVTIASTGQSHAVLRAIDDGTPVSLGTLAEISLPLGEKNLQFKFNGSSGQSAAFTVEVRNGAGDWIVADTITLSFTDQTYSVAIYRQWDQLRFNCSAQSGTNAKAYVVVG